jgi:uncharacterized protein (TIGR03435 family)
MRIAKNLSVNKKLFVSASRALAVCAAVVFGLAGAASSRAQNQQDMQSALAAAARDARAARVASSSTSAPITGIAATFEYEVASVKLSKTSTSNGLFRMGMRYTDDGVSVENFPLIMLFQNAYGISMDRISGAPDWMNSERYDIEAKIDPARVEEFKKLSPDEMKAARQHMLQDLLADRFKLTLHRETKELAVYNLVIAKGGPKLQETKPEDKTADGGNAKKDGLADGLAAAKGSSGGPSSVSGGGNSGGGKSVAIGSAGGASMSFSRGGTRSTTGRGVAIQNLVATLANACGRPVIDKTGLTGKYDYKLEYAPEDAQADADSNAPSIYTAVQEQLGLKLESAKGPVEIFVIDHVEKPSEN